MSADRLDRLARRLAGSPAPPPPAPRASREPESRISREALLSRAGAAAVAVLAGGVWPGAASARASACGPGVAGGGSYRSYTACVNGWANRSYHETLDQCRLDPWRRNWLAELRRNSLRDPFDPWAVAEFQRGLGCFQDAYKEWSRVADHCAENCPLPPPPRRKGPTQPVPKAPPGPSKVPCGPENCASGICCDCGWGTGPQCIGYVPDPPCDVCKRNCIGTCS